MPNSTDAADLTSFIENTQSEGHLRVEQDFGGGYVRLKSSEAQKRQAAQDIRSTEDIVVELLRNAHDAGAHRIFLALSRDGDKRSIVVIDDGEGIPVSMHKRVFEPRVTSKLDTAHMDKWGMHGRGMALYAVSVNSETACILVSEEGKGTSLSVKTDLGVLSEKTDQSTFPHFELRDGVYAMRGPRNTLRTAAEFALEYRNVCELFCGSFTEIAATLYTIGRDITTPTQRAFLSSPNDLGVVAQLACCANPHDFAQQAEFLGLPISERSARRIIDGEIKPIPSIMQRLEQESFPQNKKNMSEGPSSDTEKTSKTEPSRSKDMRHLKIDRKDIDELAASIDTSIDDLAQRYYLEHGEPEIRVDADHIHVSIPIKKLT